MTLHVVSFATVHRSAFQNLKTNDRGISIRRRSSPQPPPPVARRRGVRRSLTQGEHRRRNCLLRAHTRKLSKACAPSGFLSRRSLMKRLLIIVSAGAHSQSSYGRRRFQVRPVSMPLKFCYPFTAGVVSTAPPHCTPLYPTVPHPRSFSQGLHALSVSCTHPLYLPTPSSLYPPTPPL